MEIQSTTPSIDPFSSNAEFSSSEQSSNTGGVSIEQSALSAQGTDESSSPLGYSHLGYSSRELNNNLFLFNENRPDYIKAAIGTPPEVAEMYQAGVANMFFEGWQGFVHYAAEVNGGMGNAKDGYLAFSENHGFVRLNNEGMSGDQNRKLAAISLQMGIPIEKLPSRTSDSAIENENINRWVNEFIEKYETGFQEFVEIPQKGMKISDGRRRYIMKQDPASGMVVSGYYKKRGGLVGFAQKAFKPISTIMDGISMIGSFIPGWGQIAAGVAQGVKLGTGLLASGGKNIEEFIRGGIGMAAGWLSGNVINPIANKVSEFLPAIDFSSLGLSGFAPTTNGFSFSAKDFIQNFGNSIIKGIGSGKFRWENVLADSGNYLAGIFKPKNPTGTNNSSIRF